MIKPKEKPMTEIQMTKEQAKDFLIDIGLSHIINTTLSEMEEKGYIVKSELETLVEEAEEVYREFYNCHTEYIEHLQICNTHLEAANKTIKKFYKVIQALKSTHPEFKK